MDPVTNCRSLALLSSSKVSTACQNHLTMLLSATQCFSRVLDFQSLTSILSRPPMMSCEGVQRQVTSRTSKQGSRHTSHAQDVKGGDLQCLNRLAPDLGKQRVQQDARSPVPPTHGHLVPLCNPWPVAHAPVLTTKSTFVVLCHIHEELVQENQLARPKGPSVKKGHIRGWGWGAQGP